MPLDELGPGISVCSRYICQRPHHDARRTRHDDTHELHSDLGDRRIGALARRHDGNRHNLVGEDAHLCKNLSWAHHHNGATDTRHDGYHDGRHGDPCGQIWKPQP